MKIPDYEYYHHFKGSLLERIEALGNENLKTAARSHITRAENRVNSAMEALVLQVVDELYFVREILDAEKSEKDFSA